MNTIKLNSTDVEAIKRWQFIIGVTADGSFGPATEAATKVWQTQHKLAPDGIVGPASWSIALGTKFAKPTQKTSGATADNAAYEIAKTAAPNMPEKHRQYVLTVARGEGFYGQGWQNPSAATIAQSEKYGLTGYEGRGSNNWGAVQGTGSAGSFEHVDYDASGKPYHYHYKRYAQPSDAFLDMARIILKGGKRGAQGEAEIKAAIDKGSLRDAVFKQHENGYFELAPEKYLASVMRNYDILSVNTDWKRTLSEKGSGMLGKVLGALGFMTAIAFGWKVLR